MGFIIITPVENILKIRKYVIVAKVLKGSCFLFPPGKMVYLHIIKIIYFSYNYFLRLIIGFD